MKQLDSSTAAERTNDATAMKSGPGPRLLSAQSAAKYLGVAVIATGSRADRGPCRTVRCCGPKESRVPLIKPRARRVKTVRHMCRLAELVQVKRHADDRDTFALEGMYGDYGTADGR